MFWRNYFYRVNLAKQSTQINTPDNTSDFISEEFDTSALDVEKIRREIEQSKKTSGRSMLFFGRLQSFDFVRRIR